MRSLSDKGRRVAFFIEGFWSKLRGLSRELIVSGRISTRVPEICLKLLYTISIEISTIYNTILTKRPTTICGTRLVPDKKDDELLDEAFILLSLS